MELSVTLSPIVNDDPFKIRLGKDLSSEMSAWLLLNKQYEPLRALLNDIASLPDKGTSALYLSKDRLLHAQAGLALHDKDWNQAKNILRTHCFPTYGSARQDLINLWLHATYLEEETRKGAPLTLMERVRIRRRIGCDGDSSGTGAVDALDASKDTCKRGPPNLGYAY